MPPTSTNPTLAFDFSGISGGAGLLVIKGFKKSPCPVHGYARTVHALSL
jgi:hypothetical protein